MGLRNIPCVEKMKFLDELSDVVIGFGYKRQFSSNNVILDLKRSNPQANNFESFIGGLLDRVSAISVSQRRSYKLRDHTDRLRNKLTYAKGGSLEDKRDHAMLLLALNTGLRRAEICDLRVIDIHEHTVTAIRGKGEKTRGVYLDSHTRSVLMDYIRIRNNQELPYVFTTRKGKVNEHCMGTIARRIRQKTVIEFLWQKCRHTYANNLIRNDVDLETIRKMLGPADLGTTQVYSMLDSGGAIERFKNRNVKFYKEGKRFKSSKIRTLVDGPAGI